MVLITIIVIVVVAILTLVIFGLAWLGYSSCIKAYKAEIEQGKYDREIYKEFYSKNKRKQIITKAISVVMICVLVFGLSGLLITGIIYKSEGENFIINNKTIMVIKTGSMSEFYDDVLRAEYEALGYNSSLQFSVGDICVFEKIDPNVDDINLGEVYGYKQKNIIITHRVIDVYNNVDDDGVITSTYYIFRGDNNPTRDQVLVSDNRILYHYTGRKIPAIGAFVLYAQSYLGLWSLFSIVGITISSDIVLHKINKCSKDRADQIGGKYEREV